MILHAIQKLTQLYLPKYISCRLLVEVFNGNLLPLVEQCLENSTTFSRRRIEQFPAKAFFAQPSINDARGVFGLLYGIYFDYIGACEEHSRALYYGETYPLHFSPPPPRHLPPRPGTSPPPMYWPTHHTAFSLIDNKNKNKTFLSLLLNILQLPFWWAKISLRAFWGNLGADNDAIFAKKTENAARKSARVLVIMNKRSAEKKLERFPPRNSAVSTFSAIR